MKKEKFITFLQWCKINKDDLWESYEEAKNAYAALQNTKVATQRRAVGTKVPSLLDNGSLTTRRVSAGVPPSDNTSQHESGWPKCDNSLCGYWRHGAINCTLDKCKW